jgi:hypothetical protein
VQNVGLLEALAQFVTPQIVEHGQRVMPPTISSSRNERIRLLILSFVPGVLERQGCLVGKGRVRTFAIVMLPKRFQTYACLDK